MIEVFTGFINSAMHFSNKNRNLVINKSKSSKIWGCGAEAKTKTTVIDIPCEFYIRKNDVKYKYYINLVEAIIRHQNFLLTCKKLFTVAFPYHVKIRIINVRNSFLYYKARIFYGDKKHDWNILRLLALKKTIWASSKFYWFL